MEWFKFESFIVFSGTKVVLKVPATVDHSFFLSLKILWYLYNTSLRTIDALALLSNNILKVCTLLFLLSSEVPGLIFEFVEFLQHGFGVKITLKVIGYKSVALNNCLVFKINLFLGWLTRWDLIDMWFKLAIKDPSNF